MKIKELLRDEDLYELWMIVDDAIFEVLLDSHTADDISEATRRRAALRQQIRKHFIRPHQIPKNNPFQPKLGFDTWAPEKRSF